MHILHSLNLIRPIPKEPKFQSLEIDIFEIC